MKKQILTLIIGMLIGAIITTGVFLILNGNNKNKGNRMNMGEPHSINGNVTGQNGENKKNMRRNNQDTNNNNDNNVDATQTED